MLTIKKILREHSFFCSFLLLVIVYYLILKNIYPGYFSPIIPHHSDIIDYPFDGGSKSFFELLLRDSRPLGMWLTRFFGYFGQYKGVMISGIFCTLGSMLITIKIAEKETGYQISLFNKCVYYIFVCASSSFYLNYTFDMYNVYALFFCLAGILYWEYKKHNMKILDFIICAFLFLCSSMCKETYIVSIIVFFCLQTLIIKRKQEIILFFISIMTGGISLLQAKMVKSPFAAMTDSNEFSPYYTSFAISDIFATFKFYIMAFINWGIFLLIIIAFIYLIKRKLRIRLLILPVIGLCSYIPYLILPNRTIPHSFFISYIITFSIILFIKMEGRSLISKSIEHVIWIFAIIAFIYSNNSSTNMNSYAISNFYIASEYKMNLTLKSINEIKNEIRDDDIVLVAGLEDTAETLFRSVFATGIYLGNIQIKVLTDYEAFTGYMNDNVEYILAENVEYEQYDLIIDYSDNICNIERISR